MSFSSETNQQGSIWHPAKGYTTRNKQKKKLTYSIQAKWRGMVVQLLCWNIEGWWNKQGQ
jgi:hypothetical protein